jgi:hypothetical protein
MAFFDSYFGYDLVDIAEALALNPSKRICLHTLGPVNTVVSFHCTAIYHDSSNVKLLSGSLANGIRAA